MKKLFHKLTSFTMVFCDISYGKMKLDQNKMDKVKCGNNFDIIPTSLKKQ